MSEKSTRVGGQSCRLYIQKLQLFHNSGSNHRHPKGSTLWSEWATYADGTPSLYVVYSYGRHWPLYINWNGVWFSNTDKYSRTTTKHASQTHPLTQCVPLSKIDMEYLVLFGRPQPDILVKAAQLKLLSDDLISEVTKARIAA